MTTKQQLLTKMESIGSCGEAMEWVRSQEGSAQKIWKRCKRGDWMLWYAARTAYRKLVGLAACLCAREALKYVPVGEDRPRIAIETTERYWRGEATIDEVRNAAANAYRSAYAANADRASAAAANAAASAAASAADYVDAADYAASAAADYVDAAGYAASAAASTAAFAATDARAAARLLSRAHSADLVRTLIQKVPL